MCEWHTSDKLAYKPNLEGEEHLCFGPYNQYDFDW